MINLSAFSAATAFNGKTHAIKSGTTTLAPFGPGGLLIQIAVLSKDGWKIIFRRERLVQPNQRTCGFIFDYQSNPEIPPEVNPPPATVTVINEPISDINSHE